MAIRLEKSGELYLIRGKADESEPPKKKSNVGLWLALVGLVGLCAIAPQALGWAAASHTLKVFLIGVR